jgi:hypothetical protein
MAFRLREFAKVGKKNERNGVGPKNSRKNSVIRPRKVLSSSNRPNLCIYVMNLF